MRTGKLNAKKYLQERGWEGMSGGGDFVQMKGEREIRT